MGNMLDTAKEQVSPIGSPVFMEFSKVTFRLPEDDVPVLRDVSFSIQQGERVVIIGPKGSGKITLLYLMNRLYPASCDGIISGAIKLWKKEHKDYSPGEVNARIATVFQDPDSQFCMPAVEEEAALHELHHLIHTRANEELAILIVTHDMEFVASLADTVFLLNKGQLTGRYNAVNVWKDEVLLLEHSLLPPVGGILYGTS